MLNAHIPTCCEALEDMKIGQQYRIPEKENLRLHLVYGRGEPRQETTTPRSFSLCSPSPSALSLAPPGIKMALGLLSAENANAFSLPLFWGLLLGGLTFSLGSVVVMSQGLRDFDVLFTIPVLEGAQVTSGCLSALVLLREFDLRPWGDIVGFLSCIAIVVLGMGIMLFCGTKNKSRASSSCREVGFQDHVGCCPRARVDGEDDCESRRLRRVEQMLCCNKVKRS